MKLIEATLKACGAGPEHITMVREAATLLLLQACVVAHLTCVCLCVQAHVYLTDNTKERFAEMNAGYLEYWGDRPLTSRITVGCSSLALGCSVEIDVVAKM